MCVCLFVKERNGDRDRERDENRQTERRETERVCERDKEREHRQKEPSVNRRSLLLRSSHCVCAQVYSKSEYVTKFFAKKRK